MSVARNHGVVRRRRGAGRRVAPIPTASAAVLTHGPDDDRFLDQLVGGLPLGICLYDEDLVVCWANRPALEGTAGGPEALLGRPASEVAPPPVAEMLGFLRRSEHPEGFTFSCLWRANPGDGDARRLRVHAFPIRSAAGHMIAVVAQDVSEQIDVDKARLRLLDRERRARDQADSAMREALARAEELRDTHALLRFQAELFRATAQLSPDWVFAFEPAGRLIFVNDAVCRWIGIPSGRLLGRRLADIFPVDVCAALLQRAERIFAAGKPEAFIQPIAMGDGRGAEFVFTVGVSAVEGRRAALIGLGREITDLADDRRALVLSDARELAARREVDSARRVLEMHERRLRELDASKDEILALVSHDLRTPLTSVAGYAQLLLQDAADLSDRHMRFAETIVRNCERLMANLDDMMLIAQHQAGALTIRPEMVDLSAIAVQCRATALPTAEAAGISIGTEVPGWLAVVGDPGRLGQLLDNLVANAVKYSQPGAYVLISAAAVDGHVRVAVSDNGPGIPVEEQDRIFERFTRARNAAAGGVKGFGLGLTIAKAIVEAHGGRIGVESMPGTGSTFWFTLPVARPDGHPDDDV